MSWMVKITPIHNNDACKENGFKTENGYCSYEVYREAENNLIEAGFDVIVFVPSMDEENGNNHLWECNSWRIKNQTMSFTWLSGCSQIR